jgi:hypothetical protein
MGEHRDCGICAQPAALELSAALGPADSIVLTHDLDSFAVCSRTCAATALRRMAVIVERCSEALNLERTMGAS